MPSNSRATCNSDNSRGQTYKATLHRLRLRVARSPRIGPVRDHSVASPPIADTASLCESSDCASFKNSWVAAVRQNAGLGPFTRVLANGGAPKNFVACIKSSQPRFSLERGCPIGETAAVTHRTSIFCALAGSDMSLPSSDHTQDANRSIGSVGMSHENQTAIEHSAEAVNQESLRTLDSASRVPSPSVPSEDDANRTDVKTLAAWNEDSNQSAPSEEWSEPACAKTSNGAELQKNIDSSHVSDPAPSAHRPISPSPPRTVARVRSLCAAG